VSSVEEFSASAALSFFFLRVECSMPGIIDRVDALEIRLPQIDQDKLQVDTREDDHDDAEAVDDEEPINPPHPPPRRQHCDD
jgi:hypothetical protein